MRSSQPGAPRVSGFTLRDYTSADSEAVNETAVSAFSEFKDAIGDWPAFERGVRSMSTLAAAGRGELIVATMGDSIAGAVGYVGPGIPKQDWFDQEWPVVRLLVVRPDYRGLGIGRALTEECVRRARRDGAPLIALHTTPIMDRAVGMYERMGFGFYRDSPPRWGVPYGIWVKHLT